MSHVLSFKQVATGQPSDCLLAANSELTMVGLANQQPTSQHVELELFESIIKHIKQTMNSKCHQHPN